MTAIDDFLRYNQTHPERGAPTGLTAAPTRKVAVVACMDARLDVAAVLGLPRGAAHVIRNAGGVVTEDVLRSLAVSQGLLGTREVMLIHHTDCGIANFDEQQIAEAIEEAAGTRPPFPALAIADIDESVRTSIARIASCPFLAARDGVRGFVFEVKTGELREVS